MQSFNILKFLQVRISVAARRDEMRLIEISIRQELSR